MRFAQAQQGIQHALNVLKPITQTNLVSIINERKEISWYNRQSGIFQRIYYPLEYQRLLDSHQYSLLLSDGAFFQFFYEFNEQDVLTKARLAFYPVPSPTSDSLSELIEAADHASENEDEALWDHLHNWIDLLDDGQSILTNTSHIRFDYDCTATSHEPSHLQLGAMQDFRLGASYFPLPVAFIELVANLLNEFGDIHTASLGHAQNNSLSLATIGKIIALRP